MAHDASPVERPPDDGPPVALDGLRDLIISPDGRRLVDRPRNLREWVIQEIAHFRRRRARRRGTPT